MSKEGDSSITPTGIFLSPSGLNDKNIAEISISGATINKSIDVLFLTKLLSVAFINGINFIIFLCLCFLVLGQIIFVKNLLNAYLCYFVKNTLFVWYYRMFRVQLSSIYYIFF